ncbi:amidohydrolase family protein [Tardiphaga sp. vice352]|uniref:amidohydrolase family protein n=1 Tax=unclassified Tardiphaga TaxID=2631404 RepID=UPI0011646EA3|nr:MULTISPECIES: amidohydrolase family protein [unclassified Tardiphaga]MBC7583133.1 amidohydrolase family protein [Tardiphaga sp.]QDM14814.1 amidohydrolase family protein [Tardiphaga sp. vice278]QDM19921.1 amidohydrolase family protein [Tardiphaga sp. vice154]QDM24995.1 amidohydrolase family protein [Tardiphaga sp. vice304]QDM30205.1 amidohydrolase family protein [Tardiphaga sp. vice352]
MPTLDSNSEPRACPGPQPVQRTTTRFIVPPGAVDTHAHVIGLPPEYPFVASRSYTPPAASAADYLAMLDATAMTYGVLTQVSVHGTDNRLLVETLQANRQRLRGIAVIPLDCPDNEKAALKEAGVVGLRINVLYGGGVGFSQLEDYAAVCREMGWHLQFLIDAGDLPALASRFAKLPVPFLIDHMGHFPTTRGTADTGFQVLLSLVRDGGWVRLSGAYRTSTEGGPPYGDTIPFARLLAEAAPERCVWGSDWPHVANWDAMMGVNDLLDLLADWVPDDALRQRVLVDNPQRLFGFPAV